MQANNDGNAAPAPIVPHPNLSDDVNLNICLSRLQGGIFLVDLDPGDMLELATDHRCYLFEYCGNGCALLSGHPQFCPQSVPVDIHGSSWGGAMLKLSFIGKGMCLEYRHPSLGMLQTSPIREIRVLVKASSAAA